MATPIELLKGMQVQMSERILLFCSQTPITTTGAQGGPTVQGADRLCQTSPSDARRPGFLSRVGWKLGLSGQLFLDVYEYRGEFNISLVYELTVLSGHDARSRSTRWDEFRGTWSLS